MIARVTEGSAADAPGAHPRAPGARPRTLQPRWALRTRGGADAQNAPAARPSSAAGLPPHRPWGPGRPSGGLGEAWGSSAAPPTYPHPPRRGTAAGKGKGAALQAAVRRQPRLPGPSSRGSPRSTRCQNLNRPGTAAPRAASPAPPLPPARPATRRVPARGRPAQAPGTLPRSRPARAVPRRDPRHGDTAPGPARCRDAPVPGDDTTTDGAAGAPSPRCPGARPRRCGPRADPRHRHPLLVRRRPASSPARQPPRRRPLPSPPLPLPPLPPYLFQR